MRFDKRSTLCWILSLALALQQILVWQQQVAVQEAQEKANKQITAEELKRAADEMEKVFQALEAARNEIPHDTFDPQAIVDEVGSEPDKLFEWVRDHTYLVPYRGVLRDHRGVLMDRLGNSLDRALLMLVLLNRAGHQRIQLAFAELTDEQARKLLVEARPIPEGGALKSKSLTEQDFNDHLDQSAKTYGVDAQRVRDVLERVNIQSHRLNEDALQQTTEQSAALLDMLAQKIDIPKREEQIAEIQNTAIESLRQHWWLQWNDGEKWIDLDPSLPTAIPGQSLTNPKRTVAPDRINEELQDDVHQVVIRVVIERWSDGQLEQMTVLTQPLWPSAFIGQRIAIHHAPLHWPQTSDWLAGEESIANLKSAVLKETEWMPVISAESARAAKNAFTVEGHITTPKNLPSFVKAALAGQEFVGGLEKSVQGVGRSVGGLLGGGRSGDRNDDQPEPAIERNPNPKSILTAEWIEYEVRAPGREAQTIRREVFDLVGPASRVRAAKQESVAAPEINDRARLQRGFALLGETEILLNVCQLSPEFIADLAISKSLANREMVPKMLRSIADQDHKSAAGLISQMARMPSQLYNFAVARHQWSGNSADLYLDSINIVNFHQRIELDQDGRLKGTHAFDIVTNEIGVHPQTAKIPFQLRLEQGVLDTNCESMLIGGTREFDGTADLFRARQSVGVPWLACATKEDIAEQSANVPQDVEARMQHDVASGSVVIAPHLSGRQQQTYFGWWRINPRTGSALGIGHRGWGQTSTEYVLMVIAGVGMIASLYSCAFSSEPRSKAGTAVCALGFLCIALPFLVILPFFMFPLIGLGVLFAAMLLAAPFAAPAAVGAYLGVCGALASVGSSGIF